MTKGVTNNLILPKSFTDWFQGELGVSLQEVDTITKDGQVDLKELEAYFQKKFPNGNHLTLGVWKNLFGTKIDATDSVHFRVLGNYYRKKDDAKAGQADRIATELDPKGSWNLLLDLLQKRSKTFNTLPHDPSTGTLLIHWMYQDTDFPILPVETQNQLIDEYVYSLHLNEKDSSALAEVMKKTSADIRKRWTDPRMSAHLVVLQALNQEGISQKLKSEAQEQPKMADQMYMDMDTADRYQREAPGKVKAAAPYHQEAVRLFELALSIDSENPVAHRYLAAHYYQVEGPSSKKAKRHLIKALKQERSLEGLRELQRLAAQDKTISDSWDFLGQELMKQGRYAWAKMVYRKAIEVTDKSDEGRLSHYQKSEQLAEDRIHYKTSIPKEFAEFTAILDFLMEGKDGILLAPMDDGSGLARKGDKVIGVEEILNGLEKNIGEPKVQLALRRFGIIPKNWFKGDKLKPEVLKNIQEQGLGKVISDYHYEIAKKSKRPSIKEKHLLIARNFDLKNVDRHLELGRFYSEQKKYSKAVEAFKWGLKADSKNESVKNGLAEAAYNNGDYDIAFKYKDYGVSVVTEVIDGEVRKIETLAQVGDMEGAAKLANKTRDALGNYISTYLGGDWSLWAKQRENQIRIVKAEIQAYQGKTKEAEETFNSVLVLLDHDGKKNPNVSEFYFLKARVYNNLGNYEKALAEYDAAIKNAQDETAKGEAQLLRDLYIQDLAYLLTETETLRIAAEGAEEKDQTLINFLITRETALAKVLKGGKVDSLTLEKLGSWEKYLEYLDRSTQKTNNLVIERAVLAQLDPFLKGGYLKGINQDQELQKYVSIEQTESGPVLKFTEEYQYLDLKGEEPGKKDKLGVWTRIAGIGELAKTKELRDSEKTHPLHQAFYDSRISQLENRFPEAQTKRIEFKRLVQAEIGKNPNFLAENPQTAQMYEETRAMLRSFSLDSLKIVRSEKESIANYRKTGVGRKDIQHSQEIDLLMDKVEACITDGLADTPDEAMALLKSWNDEVLNQFLQHGVNSGEILDILNIIPEIPFRSETDIDRVRRHGDFVDEFAADKNATPPHDVVTVRLNGGVIRRQFSYAQDEQRALVKIVIGREGGVIKLDASESYYVFPPLKEGEPDRERIVLLQNHDLFLEHLTFNKDYTRENSIKFYGQPEKVAHRKHVMRYYLNGVKLENLDITEPKTWKPEARKWSALERQEWDKKYEIALKFFGKDNLWGKFQTNEKSFVRLFALHSEAGLKETLTPNGKHKRLFEIGSALWTEGSVDHATEIYLQAFGEPLQKAIDLIPADEQREMLAKLRRDKEWQYKNAISEGLSQYRNKNPDEFKERFPHLWPSEAEMKAMVDEVVQREFRNLLIEKALPKVREWAGDKAKWEEMGGDDWAKKAFDDLVEMNDPFDDWDNVSTRGWDKFKDVAIDVAIEIVLFAVTMGVGSLIRTGIRSIAWVSRIQTASRIGYVVGELGIRSAAVVGMAATNNALHGDFSGKNLGITSLHFAAFEAGTGLWGKAAKFLNIGDDAVALAFKEGKTLVGLGKKFAGFQGLMFTTSSISYSMAWAAGQSGSFAGHYGQMVLMHFGGKLINVSTDYRLPKMEMASQARRTLARDKYLELTRSKSKNVLPADKSKGRVQHYADPITPKEALNKAMAYANEKIPSVVGAKDTGKILANHRMRKELPDVQRLVEDMGIDPLSPKGKVLTRLFLNSAAKGDNPKDIRARINKTKPKNLNEFLKKVLKVDPKSEAALLIRAELAEILVKNDYHEVEKGPHAGKGRGNLTLVKNFPELARYTKELRQPARDLLKAGGIEPGTKGFRQMEDAIVAGALRNGSTPEEFKNFNAHAEKIPQVIEAMIGKEAAKTTEGKALAGQLITWIMVNHESPEKVEQFFKRFESNGFKHGILSRLKLAKFFPKENIDPALESKLRIAIWQKLLSTTKSYTELREEFTTFSLRTKGAKGSVEKILGLYEKELGSKTEVGEELTAYFLLNAIHSSKRLTDTKKYFTKLNKVAPQMGRALAKSTDALFKGSPASAQQVFSLRAHLALKALATSKNPKAALEAVKKFAAETPVIEARANQFLDQVIPSQNGVTGSQTAHGQALRFDLIRSAALSKRTLPEIKGYLQELNNHGLQWAKAMKNIDPLFHGVGTGAGEGIQLRNALIVKALVTSKTPQAALNQVKQFSERVPKLKTKLEKYLDKAAGIDGYSRTPDGRQVLEALWHEAIATSYRLDEVPKRFKESVWRKFNGEGLGKLDLQKALEVLGLKLQDLSNLPAKDAKALIKKAYRDLMKIHHPDLESDPEKVRKAVEKSQEVSVAYGILEQALERNPDALKYPYSKNKSNAAKKTSTGQGKQTGQTPKALPGKTQNVDQKQTTQSTQSANQAPTRAGLGGPGLMGVVPVLPFMESFLGPQGAQIVSLMAFGTGGLALFWSGRWLLSMLSGNGAAAPKVLTTQDILANSNAILKEYNQPPALSGIEVFQHDGEYFIRSTQGKREIQMLGKVGRKEGKAPYELGDQAMAVDEHSRVYIDGFEYEVKAGKLVSTTNKTQQELSEFTQDEYAGTPLGKMASQAQVSLKELPKLYQELQSKQQSLEKTSGADRQMLENSIAVLEKQITDHSKKIDQWKAGLQEAKEMGDFAIFSYLHLNNSLGKLGDPIVAVDANHPDQTINVANYQKGQDFIAGGMTLLVEPGTDLGKTATAIEKHYQAHSGEISKDAILLTTGKILWSTVGKQMKPAEGESSYKFRTRYINAMEPIINRQEDVAEKILAKLPKNPTPKQVKKAIQAIVEETLKGSDYRLDQTQVANHLSKVQVPKLVSKKSQTFDGKPEMILTFEVMGPERKAVQFEVKVREAQEGTAVAGRSSDSTTPTMTPAGTRDKGGLIWDSIGIDDQGRLAQVNDKGKVVAVDPWGRSMEDEKNLANPNGEIMELSRVGVSTELPGIMFVDFSNLNNGPIAIQSYEGNQVLRFKINGQWSDPMVLEPGHSVGIEKGIDLEVNGKRFKFENNDLIPVEVPTPSQLGTFMAEGSDEVIDFDVTSGPQIVSSEGLGLPGSPWVVMIEMTQAPSNQGGVEQPARFRITPLVGEVKIKAGIDFKTRKPKYRQVQEPVEVNGDNPLFLGGVAWRLGGVVGPRQPQANYTMYRFDIAEKLKFYAKGTPARKELEGIVHNKKIPEPIREQAKAFLHALKRFEVQFPAYTKAFDKQQSKMKTSLDHRNKMVRAWQVIFRNWQDLTSMNYYDWERQYSLVMEQTQGDLSVLDNIFIAEKGKANLRENWAKRYQAFQKEWNQNKQKLLSDPEYRSKMEEEKGRIGESYINLSGKRSKQYTMAELEKFFLQEGWRGEILDIQYQDNLPTIGEYVSQHHHYDPETGYITLTPTSDSLSGTQEQPLVTVDVAVNQKDDVGKLVSKIQSNSKLEIVVNEVDSKGEMVLKIATVRQGEVMGAMTDVAGPPIYVRLKIKTQVQAVPAKPKVADAAKTSPDPKTTNPPKKSDSQITGRSADSAWPVVVTDRNGMTVKQEGMYVGSASVKPNRYEGYRIKAVSESNGHLVFTIAKIDPNNPKKLLPNTELNVRGASKHPILPENIIFRKDVDVNLVAPKPKGEKKEPNPLKKSQPKPAQEESVGSEKNTIPGKPAVPDKPKPTKSKTEPNFLGKSADSPLPVAIVGKDGIPVEGHIYLASSAEADSADPYRGWVITDIKGQVLTLGKKGFNFTWKVHAHPDHPFSSYFTQGALVNFVLPKTPSGDPWKVATALAVGLGFFLTPEIAQAAVEHSSSAGEAAMTGLWIALGSLPILGAIFNRGRGNGPAGNLPVHSLKVGKFYTIGRGTRGKDDGANFIKIDSSEVSKKHVELLLDKDGTLAIRDLGSYNGTWAPQRDGTWKKISTTVVKPEEKFAIGRVTEIRDKNDKVVGYDFDNAQVFRLEKDGNLTQLTEPGLVDPKPIRDSNSLGNQPGIGVLNGNPAGKWWGANRIKDPFSAMQSGEVIFITRDDSGFFYASKQDSMKSFFAVSLDKNGIFHVEPAMGSQTFGGVQIVDRAGIERPLSEVGEVIDATAAITVKADSTSFSIVLPKVAENTIVDRPAVADAAETGTHPDPKTIIPELPLPPPTKKPVSQQLVKIDYAGDLDKISTDSNNPTIIQYNGQGLVRLYRKLGSNRYVLQPYFSENNPVKVTLDGSEVGVLAMVPLAGGLYNVRVKSDLGEILLTLKLPVIAE